MTAKISRRTIVETAFDVLEEVGIDGLTVRALASRLGVKAPALYWHVDSKQALLDEMGTEIARRISVRTAEPASESFEAELRRYAEIMREEYLAHRDGARTFAGTRLTDPDILRRQEGALAWWTARGVPLSRVVDAFSIVTAFVVGFVIEEQERADSARYSVADRDEAVGVDHPLSIAAGHHSYRPAHERFTAQLDLLVPGLAN